MLAPLFPRLTKSDRTWRAWAPNWKLFLEQYPPPFFDAALHDETRKKGR